MQFEHTNILTKTNNAEVIVETLDHLRFADFRLFPVTLPSVISARPGIEPMHHPLPQKPSSLSSSSLIANLFAKLRCCSSVKGSNVVFVWM